MIHLATTSLSYFHQKWEDLRQKGIIDIRWFSIGTLYFISDTEALNQAKSIYQK